MIVNKKKKKKEENKLKQFKDNMKKKCEKK